jgi:2-polyprenyl-3-methyl-5-hydroxy-6-metoxy-1,4-benzoquinol methylase/predicted RNA-binding Zn-ribbon protein involved in translation (DUF1610 family)
MTMFNENDIRPKRFDFEKEAAYARDVARLLSHKDDFVRVSCPACGVDSGCVKWQKLGLSYCECDRCGTVYVSPRPGPLALKDYYTNSEVYEYWCRYIFPASEAVRREKIFRPRLARLLEMCSRHRIEHGTLVEVGPGFGTFCEEAKASERFKKVIAVEPTPSLAAACRERGIEVIEKPVEETSLEEQRVDVVVAFEVIEHLFNPAEFVRACARSVQPGGLIVLTCPNVRGFEVEALGPIADTVDTEHLNYFNPDSLGILVGNNGFEVLEISTPGVLDADIVRNKALSGQFDLSGQRFLQIVLLERWAELGQAFQQFLQESRLSSHMWLVGRKN